MIFSLSFCCKTKRMNGITIWRTTFPIFLSPTMQLRLTALLLLLILSLYEINAFTSVHVIAVYNNTDHCNPADLSFYDYPGDAESCVKAAGFRSLVLEIGN